MVILFLFLSLTAAVQSCKDSYGIDPKVQTSYDEPDEIGDSTPNQFSRDSLICLLDESYTLDGFPMTSTWTNQTSKYEKADIKVDTTDSKIRLWLKMDLTSPEAGTQTKRIDRIISFQLSFKGVIEYDTPYILDGDQDSGRWFSVVIEHVMDNNFKTYSRDQIYSKLSFKYSSDENLEINLGTDLTPIAGIETKSLGGQLIIPLSSDK